MKTCLAILLLSLTAFAQKSETCNHCPSPSEMNLQFPYDTNETVKPKFFTKTWTLAEGFHVLAGTTDILITLKRENPKTCLEGNNGFPEFVKAPELAGEFSAEVGMSFFVRWMMTREKPPKPFRFISYMTPVWGITEHVYGATRWYYNCQR